MSIPVCDHCFRNRPPGSNYHSARSASDVCGSEDHSIGAFEVGKTYLTQEGKLVTVLEEDTTPSYEWVMGDDNICRYNRPGERGRVTASNFDMSDPRNLVVGSEQNE